MAQDIGALLKNRRSIVAPGVGDAFGARLVEGAGFDCVYMSGYAVSACLGYPDVGLVTLSEMVNQATRICSSVSIPVIADGDNGHGNVINVMRTVREFERAGVSAIHLEDQVLPKRCGDPDLKGHTSLISIPEMCAKIRAARDARSSPGFMIIARSDSLTSHGMAEALQRANAYREAGADGIMLHGPNEPADLQRMRSGIDGPLAITVGAWKFPMSVQSLEEAGFQIILYPLAILRRSIVAIQDCLHELKATGNVDHGAPNMMPMADLQRTMGMDENLSLEQKYATISEEYQRAGKRSL